jgi:hypothetical protein
MQLIRHLCVGLGCGILGNTVADETATTSTTPLSRSMEYMVPLLVGVNCIVVVMFLMIGFARLYPLLSMASALRVCLPCGLCSGGCCVLIPTREWWGWLVAAVGLVPSCSSIATCMSSMSRFTPGGATRPSPFTANRRLAVSCATTMQMTWSMLSSSLVLGEKGSGNRPRGPIHCVCSMLDGRSRSEHILQPHGCGCSKCSPPGNGTQQRCHT